MLYRIMSRYVDDASREGPQRDAEREAELETYKWCICFCVKDHNNVLHYSPLLKKTCVRQVVLDKWLPLNLAACHFTVGQPHARTDSVAETQNESGVRKHARVSVSRQARNPTVRHPPPFFGTG